MRSLHKFTGTYAPANSTFVKMKKTKPNLLAVDTLLATGCYNTFKAKKIKYHI